MSAPRQLAKVMLAARWRAVSIHLVMLALPMTALLLAAAVTGQTMPWLPAAVLLALVVVVITVIRVGRMDLAWLARSLDLHCAELEDSSALLFDLDQGRGGLAPLQRQRLLARLAQVELPDLRPSWPWAKILSLALVSAALLMAVLYRSPAASVPAASVVERADQISTPTHTTLGPALIRVQPPAYTGIEPGAGNALDLKVPEGSLLQWDLQIDPSPASATLKFLDRSELALSRAEDGHWRAEKTIAKSTYYYLEISGAPPLSGSENWAIEVIPDLPPQITVIEPERNLTILEQERRHWPLRFEVSDDYGLGVAELTITLAQGSGELVEVSERKLRLRGEGDARSRRYAQNLQLGAYGFARGDDLIIRLSVADNRSPQPQLARSASYILRWPAELSAEVGEIDGVVQRVMPTWFRSQRQIIIDTENLLERRPQLSHEQLASESNEIGISQHTLRLRYGQFLGEESEEVADRPGEASEHHADDGHDHGEPGQSATFGVAEDVLAAYGHTHDYAEATTLFDPRTRRLLKAALDQMWRAEEQLRTAAPQAALPFEYAALEYIKQAQQASRIYLARVGLELPPIDFSRRLSGDTRDLARPRDTLTAADQESPVRTLWSALAEQRSPLDPALISAVEQWVAEQGEGLSGGLELLATLDRLRRDPACSDCAAALRERLWPLLQAPVAGVTQRRGDKESGAVYLRALQEQAQ